MNYELMDRASDTDIEDPDTVRGDVPNMDSDDDNEPLTDIECIQKAWEILADWKDYPFMDPLFAEDMEVAYNLLCKVIESNETEVADL
ncbi:MAG: hypothetical protein ACYC27_19530 [Armatimonadota bacterium]